ncbi:MAG: cytochrome c nitrite reductase small subunit [Candidatus Sumerlaeota bacterium]|nr:cytochrome c nitrite reductase small subunit [Candidatus Sumerlaeota bacterium]
MKSWAMKRWAVLAAFLGGCIGVAGGLGLYTFHYAEGASYLSNDPAACMNCHVMREQFEGWTKSSHHAVATCNDCHTPHDFVGKWLTKGLNGYHHSLAFTTGDFHEPIQITERNARITENACRHCHGDIVEAIDQPWHVSADDGDGDEWKSLNCVRCHESVGHLH